MYDKNCTCKLFQKIEQFKNYQVLPIEIHDVPRSANYENFEVKTGSALESLNELYDQMKQDIAQGDVSFIRLTI